MKKALSLILALLMCFSIFQVAVFAEEPAAVEEVEATAEETVEAWKTNYPVLLDTLFDGEHYAHYKYVLDNNEDLRKTMAVYTAFGLYDNAWKNYFTKEANVDTCKKILMAMIEEYKYELGNSYVDGLVEALKVAKDAGEFIEKLNGFVGKYSDVLDFVETQEWSTVFQVVNTLIRLGNAWQDIRTQLIDAYSQIMSVQLANGYYIEMLEYVATNTTYEPMQKAATALIEEATTAVEEQIEFFLMEATQNLQNDGINLLLDLAVNSNVYTATAKKVWNIGASVADVLWNTSDQYAIYDALIATFHAELAIDEYATKAFDTTDANYDAARAMFGTYSLISVRAFGEDALINLLTAQSGGIINKIKSKLYDLSCTEYTANMAVLDLMDVAFFETAVADMKPVEAIAYVYCPVNVLVYDGNVLLYRVKDGEESTMIDKNLGLAKSAYCAYNKEYVKVAFLNDVDYRIIMVGTADGFVTFKKEFRNAEDVLVSYSFTEEKVTPVTKITVDGLRYCVAANGTEEWKELNDVFVIPEAKEVNWETVTDATKEVVKEETNNFFAKIKKFFQDFFAKLKAIFTFKK